MQEAVEGGACEAIVRVFALLGKRWNGLIIVTLLGGPARFSELVRRVPGLSERVLAERLSELITAGLIAREVDGGPPVSVRYKLTDRAEALRPALEELERWGQEQLLKPSKPTVHRARTGKG
ncbi:MAG: helix-turn-helix transcriptional regulator [Actinobacteria bacterium]|nr:helix-turn-helix transcriptional regulator [Actinomycetota bacterium]